MVGCCAGAKFISAKAFETAGVGAPSHLVGPPLSVDERRGRSVDAAIRAGVEVDAEMVRRLVAEGRDRPPRPALSERKTRELLSGSPPLGAVGTVMTTVIGALRVTSFVAGRTQSR